MIVDDSESRIISSLGWCDGGKIWVCDTDSARMHLVKFDRTKYVQLRQGSNDHFAAGRFVSKLKSHILTAHQIASPKETISRISITATSSSFEGDESVWEHLPKAYVVNLRKHGYILALVRHRERRVETQPLEWYDDSYDHMYQGVIGVTEVPGRELLIFSVQRCRELVMYDPRERNVVRRLNLPGEAGGNPRLRFRRTAEELWADNYDTLIRLDSRDFAVKDFAKLQIGMGKFSSLFIGDFAFNRDESLCAVPRPHTGDVLALDTQSFELTHRAVTGMEPLKVALLSDGRVFARDWMSGKLLRAKLKPDTVPTNIGSFVRTPRGVEDP